MWATVYQCILIIANRYLVLDERATDELDDNTVTKETKYSVNITKSSKKVVWVYSSMPQQVLRINGLKIQQFKTKDSEIRIYLLYLGNISKDPTVDKMKKQTELNGKVHNFSVSYKTTNINDIRDIYKYLMKKHNIV